ncbi:MAG: zinc ribbon domain-containing protein [candidate division WS1 bacterium]|jgi:putative FmdB family regulatory protein|nr:zinc ribbon domain-containing protein [candidate division WS1 bacterium]
MPLYEYKCQDCGGIQEVLQPNYKAKAPRCAQCGSKRTQRLMSAAVSRSSSRSSPTDSSCPTGTCPLS